MTFTKRFIAILLSFALAFTALSSTAFASNGIASKGKRIPYSELPEGYKSVISSDAILYISKQTAPMIFIKAALYSNKREPKHLRDTRLKAAHTVILKTVGSHL